MSASTAYTEGHLELLVLPIKASPHPQFKQLFSLVGVFTLFRVGIALHLCGHCIPGMSSTSACTPLQQQHYLVETFVCVLIALLRGTGFTPLGWVQRLRDIHVGSLWVARSQWVASPGLAILPVAEPKGKFCAFSLLAPEPHCVGAGFVVFSAGCHQYPLGTAFSIPWGSSCPCPCSRCCHASPRHQVLALEEVLPHYQT